MLSFSLGLGVCTDTCGVAAGDLLGNHFFEHVISVILPVIFSFILNIL
jgi:hypothetical protein